MVTNLVQLRAGKTPAGRRILTLLGKANGIAGRRNDVLHVVFSDALDPLTVSQLHERGHLKGKSGQELVDAINTLSIDALDLATDLIQAGRELLQSGFQNSVTWPLPSSERPPRTAEELASRGEFGLLVDPPSVKPSE